MSDIEENMASIVWRITLYDVSKKSGFKVKVEGCPRPGPWVFAEGKGPTMGAALNAAAEAMSQADQQHFLSFLDNSALKL